MFVSISARESTQQESIRQMCARQAEIHQVDSAVCSHRATRDARLLMPALAAWIAAFIAQTFPLVPVSLTAASSPSSSAATHAANPLLPALAVVTVLVVLLIVGGLIFLMRKRSKTQKERKQHRFIQPFLCGVSVVAYTVIIVFTSATAQALLIAHDPLVRARDQRENVDVIVRVTSAPIASPLRGSECRYDAEPRFVRASAITQSTGVSAIVWASGSACSVTKGEEIQLFASAQQSRFGLADVWLHVDESSAPIHRICAKGIDRVVSHLWTAFFHQCQKLSLQGRLLVPAMTVGVLGSQTLIDGKVSADSSEQAQAKRLKNMFRELGIIHLLAVSGGHFALVGGWVRRRLGIAGFPSWLCAAGTVCADLLLAAILFPSDSVTRAVMMALITCLSIGYGRPSQALSSLCTTILLLLIVHPKLALSMGFGLSCAAVLGIVTCADPLTRLLCRLRSPYSLASALAATLCAQLFTLPLQLMMGPLADARSIPINMVAPLFIDVATLLGLISLVLSTIAPHVSFACAYGASCITGVFVLVCSWMTS